MKKFIVQILIFVSLLIILDKSFILFRINEKNLFAEISAEKMRVLSSKIKKPATPSIMIVGSSHGQFGISPEILNEKLNVSALNAAYGTGANIGLQLSLLRKLIDRNIMPQLIIFGLEVFSQNSPPIYSDEFQTILFGVSNDVGKNRLMKSFRSRLFQSYFKLYSRFLPRYLSQIKAGHYSLPLFNRTSTYDLSMFSQYKKYEITDSGWVKGYALLNKEYIRYADTVFDPDQKAQADLDDYVDLCRLNGIKIVFVQIPEHIVCLKYAKKYDDFDVWVKQFISRNNCRYWNFNNLESFPISQDSLFFDSDHLNVDGASLLSDILAGYLKKYESATLGLDN
jgi:hypothetical protein